MMEFHTFISAIIPSVYFVCSFRIPIAKAILKRENERKKFNCGMKPNQPRVVSSSRNYITVEWIPCQFDEASWYTLERKDEILGWSRAYTGFKTQAEIGPLAPGNYYEFRLKVKSENEESEWSDTLFAITKDNVISASYLHRAVENGPVTNLRKILAQRPPIDIPNKQGLTPLRLAILKNNVNFMGILLSYGADILNTENGSGRTPLMMAAQKGFFEAVQLLLEKGSSWETRDRNGLTALNYAVDNSHLPVVQLAIEEGVNLNIKDRFGWNPLMRGVTLKSSLEVLTHLLDNGCDPNDSDDRNQTVLMQAVLLERAEVVKLLLKAGVNINTKNIYGHTAYDFAKHSTNENIIKMAHLLGKDPEETSKNKGTSKERK